MALDKSRRLRGYARRWSISGPPGQDYTIGALDEDDARNHALANEDWKIWRFCGGEITVREMTPKEIDQDYIKSMFAT